MPKVNKQQQFYITEMLAGDIKPATKMRAECWTDTYVNEDAGVTLAWIKSHNETQMSLEKDQVRAERLMDKVHHAGWVAKDESGNIIGSTTPFIYEDGRQDVGSLYITKEWRGRDVANKLMDKVINWFDAEKPIELTVAEYNERAKAFYRKWGFVEVPNSKHLFKDTIPSIKMIRKGDKK